MMDIEEERMAFEESNNVNPDWSFNFNEELQQYVALDHEMQLQVDEFNEHWDIWRAAWQASANREGFVLKEIKDCIEVNFDPDREDDQHSYWSGYNQAFRELKSIIEAQEQSNA